MGNRLDVAKLIDHSLLRADAQEKDIERLCKEAEDYGFFSVCVHPYFVKTTKKILAGSDTKLTTVIGFPLGVTLTSVKIFEAMECVQEGAQELDIVMNIGAAKAGRWDVVEREISGLLMATPETVHKIIIETHYLTDEEKVKASLIVMGTGAEFIKTSTGFAPGGATVKDIVMIKTVTNGEIGIKAAGGIRTLKDAMELIKAGATRIGTSHGVEIIKELS